MSKEDMSAHELELAKKVHDKVLGWLRRAMSTRLSRKEPEYAS